MSLGLTSKALLVATRQDGDSYQTAIRKYSLPQRQLLQEWQIELEVDYIFADRKRVLLLKDRSHSQNFLIRYLDGSRKDRIFSGHAQAILQLFVIESKSLIVSIAKDNCVKIWDIRSGKCLETIETRAYPYKVIFFKSNILIGWGGIPELWVWSLDTHQFLFKIEAFESYPLVVKFNLDAQSILVGMDDGTLACYALKNGNLLWSLDLSVYSIKSIYNLAIYREESAAVVSGDGGNLCVLDINRGQVTKILTGHKDSVSHLLRIGKNGLISGGFEGIIRVWNLQSGSCCAVLSGHLDLIYEMIVTADFRYLVTRDKARRIILWKADWQNAIDLR